MENLGDVATRVVMLTTQGLLETSMIILMILLCDWRIALVSLAGVAIFLVINTVMQNAGKQTKRLNAANEACVRANVVLGLDTMDIDGKELVITVSLQEGFLPRTYEYRFGLWLLDMKNALIPLTVLFVVLTLFCFFWQMAAAGHWQGFDGIHLTWFDKIPLDLMAVGILIPALALFGEYYLYSSGLLTALWGTAILCFVYLFIISFVTRCKAGTVLKNNVVCH